MTSFDEWLRALKAAGKGPVTINIDRGLPFTYTFTLSGDWSGAALAATLQIAPDTPGLVLLAFATAAPVYDADAGETTFAFSLTKAETLALPASPDNTALTQLAYDVLLYSYGAPTRLFGGVANVIGRVTYG